MITITKAPSACAGWLRGLGRIVVGAQLQAQHGVEETPGASSAAVARQAFVTPQTMNEIVRTLVSADLLTRQAHPEHGRVIQLYLTTHGKERLHKAHVHVQHVEGRMLALLNAEEQRQLGGWLCRCADTLDGLDTLR